MKNILFRINMLAKKEKQFGLTNSEKQEQQMLRADYMRVFRSSLDTILLNTTIVDPNGENVTPPSLQLAKERVSVSK
ncbi:hypothetical protein BAMA_19420 [Bacillus manliponensis]|uniref:UPF0291 protein BAMA_19420 n=1 Tax=Bacillus manliponensis TaxID=574376 RepID=A0A073K0J2_9BACI|nr:DUF896 domain-containing protein [Bacillus manliponensis]KEK19937.1 hypothetical protein BAMA_19420 [Bacillus manliponensis]